MVATPFGGSDRWTNPLLGSVKAKPKPTVQLGVAFDHELYSTTPALGSGCLYCSRHFYLAFAVSTQYTTITEPLKGVTSILFSSFLRSYVEICVLHWNT